MTLDAVRAMCAPLDAVLIAIDATVARLEAQKLTREHDLLQKVAERIEVPDPSFRSAIIMLVVDWAGRHS